MFGQHTLDVELRRTFKKQGWVLLDNLFCAEALNALDRTSLQFWERGDIRRKTEAPGWGQRPADELPDGIQASRLFPDDKRVILHRLFGSTLDDLKKSLEPQYTYSFPTVGAQGLGLHIDGDVGGGIVTVMEGLIGVLLHDVSDADQGAFQFIPGSHRKNVEFLRKHRRMPLSEAFGAIDQQYLDRSQVTPFTGRRGQAIVCHPLLNHGAGPNLGTSVRRMVFLRVNARMLNGNNNSTSEKDSLTAGELLRQDPSYRSRARSPFRFSFCHLR